RIVDLGKSGGNGRHAIEKLEEDKRLYYVAATRAQFKLYLPFYIYNNNAPWLGPVCTQLSPVVKEVFPKGEADRDVLWLSIDHHVSAAKGRKKPEAAEPRMTVPAGKAFEIFSLRESYAQRRIQLGSFSSLHKKISRSDQAVEEGPSFRAEQERREDDEGFVYKGVDLAFADSAPDELPGGTDVGLMFHDILEHMDYDAVLTVGPSNEGPGRGLMGDPGTREIILRYMEAYRVDARWKATISKIIWNTLTTPVIPIADDFVLAHLKKEERLHEVEFYYPFPVPVTGPDAVADCHIMDGFIRGFVDLIFKKDHKYYMADWKSNYLETGYDLVSMKMSMDQADYHLQYKLYAIGLLRWLKQTMGERFEPEKDFGGVFYFYLRGMGAGKGDGVYHVAPDQLGSLDQLEEEIASIIEMGCR
ncbi:MAG: PD-(D/E)XK nuclease family protein, partial [Deltaproteobacteria bacterium]|nr:PD-(D/E)XK nuclease family protein [Deltaproteobacteria bacterium]